MTRTPVDVNDTRTRSLIQIASTIRPACQQLLNRRVNDDGSHDLYIGSAAPTGKGRGWSSESPTLPTYAASNPTPLWMEGVVAGLQ